MSTTTETPIVIYPVDPFWLRSPHEKAAFDSASHIFVRKVILIPSETGEFDEIETEGE